ncbi:MAG: PrsW family glutamic-type intramembrane protease [Oscillospiraceae bacterium]|jgi:RsiW-degrading membrane proteinase PrsW (M82 family)
MIYTENIFLCLAAPLLIAVCLLKGDIRRFLVFFVVGLAACLLSAYINSFLALMVSGFEYASLDYAQSAIRLTPVCEEVMKALPLFFYLAVFKPKKEAVVSTAFAIGLGFATLENCCYLIQYGAGEFLFVLVRGFSAGIMHAICAAIMGYGVAFVQGRRQLAFAGAVGCLCAATTFHAMYNLMISGSGGWRAVGYLLPVVTAIVLLIVVRRPLGRRPGDEGQA